MEKEAKIYAGSGRKKNEGWLKCTLNIDELNKHIEEFEGKRYVKININVGKPDKYGKDVSITIDTWKPSGSQQTSSPMQPVAVDDLPF